MAGPGELVARGRPTDRVDPGVAPVGTELNAKGKTGAEGGGSGLGIDALDEARHDEDLAICAAAGEQDVVRVPVNGEDRGFDALANVLGDPPVVVLLEVADGDVLSSAGDGELVAVGRPLDLRGGAVDTQNHKGRSPDGIVVGGLPHIGVTILGARHQSVVLVIPVEASDDLVMLVKDGEWLLAVESSVSLTTEDADLVVVGADRNLGLIRVPCVARDDLGKLADLCLEFRRITAPWCSVVP